MTAKTHLVKLPLQSNTANPPQSWQQNDFSSKKGERSQELSVGLLTGFPFHWVKTGSYIFLCSCPNILLLKLCWEKGPWSANTNAQLSFPAGKKKKTRRFLEPLRPLQNYEMPKSARMWCPPLQLASDSWAGTVPLQLPAAHHHWSWQSVMQMEWQAMAPQDAGLKREWRGSKSGTEEGSSHLSQLVWVREWIRLHESWAETSVMCRMMWRRAGGGEITWIWTRKKGERVKGLKCAQQLHMQGEHWGAMTLWNSSVCLKRGTRTSFHQIPAEVTRPHIEICILKVIAVTTGLLLTPGFLHIHISKRLSNTFLASLDSAPLSTPVFGFLTWHLYFWISFLQKSFNNF